jgi:hypothetical protein
MAAQLGEDNGGAAYPDPELAAALKDARWLALEGLDRDGTCVPFEVDHFVADRSQPGTLCAWGMFNPLGPTVAGISAVAMPASGDALLVSWYRNPFASGTEVRGLVWMDVLESSSRIRKVLTPVFATNGGKDLPMLLSLPTHVRRVGNSPLSMLHLRELFFAATPRLMEENLDRACGSLEAIEDPFERASAELSSAWERGLAGTPSQAKRITRPAFRRWWDLVTDPAHVAREVDQLDEAWAGSIELVRAPRRERRG